MSVKNVVILGSTGSIGVNTLQVIRKHPKKFRVVGLSAYNNVKLLEKQVEEFRPKYISVKESHHGYFRSKFQKRRIKTLNVDQDLEELVSLKDADIVVLAIRGSAALKPFLSAVRAGKLVAPANKEALVIAGELIMREARKHGAVIVPVDSEQSAIFQALQGEQKAHVRKIILTASGGSLWNVPQNKFRSLTKKQLLNHPRWKMGEKITIDSATLMNKGFEIIEAVRLFGLGAKDIEVIIHPEAIVHSMVEFFDGSVIAQLAVTDMRIPIQYALTYPERMPTGLRPLDLTRLQKLHFYKPDLKRFPCLRLAMNVARKDGTYPSVLNASDEEAVDAFLKGKIGFPAIYEIVERVVSRHKNILKPDLKDILEADAWARREARKVIEHV